MQALHSSSALDVNIFQYWQKLNHVPLIAAACGLCRRGNKVSEKIVFENKYPIDNRFPVPPNIDVVIYNLNSFKYKRFAIECKYSEVYITQMHSWIKSEYMSLEGIW